MSSKKYDRQEALFGKEGQKKLENTIVSVVGIGGLGTHVVQQLTYLGIKTFYLIDDEVLDETNMNRYVGAKPEEIGQRKVEIAKRIITDINPNASICIIPEPLASEKAFKAIIRSDCVFGCLDNEGSRLILNELSSAYKVPYFDLATEIFPDEGVYGGRICISLDEPGCLVCLNHLNPGEAGRDLENPEAKKDRHDIYGVDNDQLGGSGPSVVSINGSVASLAITEFMVWATGQRDPITNIYYRGDKASVMPLTDDPRPDCYYCYEIRSQGDEADTQQYIREQQSNTR